MTETLSLRERKKRRTREQILAVSSRLFLEQGYAATTLEQVAAATEISVPTLLAYFPSKDRLVTAAEWVLVDDLRRRLEDPERQTSTIEIWRRYVDEHATQAQQSRRAFRAMMRIALDTPELRRTLLEISAALEAVLVDGLTADLRGSGGQDLSTLLLATTLAHGNRVALERWVTGGGKGNLRADVLAVIDLAEQTLGADPYPLRSPGARARGGVTGLGAREPHPDA